MEELHLLVQEEGRATKHAAFSVPATEPLSSQSETDQSKHGALKPLYYIHTGALRFTYGE
jgi:hypothetical protein